jgi:hypothetical protein
MIRVNLISSCSEEKSTSIHWIIYHKKNEQIPSDNLVASGKIYP